MADLDKDAESEMQGRFDDAVANAEKAWQRAEELELTDPNPDAGEAISREHDAVEETRVARDAARSAFEAVEAADRSGSPSEALREDFRKKAKEVHEKAAAVHEAAAEVHEAHERAPSE